MTIPEMITHLTSRPAKRLGIFPHRGLIAEGSAADVVLFDPETIKDMSTYEQPRNVAQGIRWVLVNGQIAMQEGKLTGVRGGRTVRRRANGSVGTSLEKGVHPGVKANGHVNGTKEISTNGHAQMANGHGIEHGVNGVSGVNGVKVN